MAYWLIGLLVVLVALLIPILAIVLDSPALQKLLEARSGAPGEHVDRLVQRVETLEDEVDDLGAALRQLREETQFLQRLIEDTQDDRPRLPPSQS